MSRASAVDIPDPQSLLLKLFVNHKGHQPATTSRTRQRIITKSVELFAAHGYAATSMRDIGAAVGIKAASIYAHFPEGKEQLLGEALDECLYDFQGFVVEPLELDQSYHEQLEHLVKRHVEYHVRNATVAESWDVLVDVDRLARLLPKATQKRVYERRAVYRDLVHALVANITDGDRLAWGRSEAILSLCDRSSLWTSSNRGLSAEEAPAFVWSLALGIMNAPDIEG